MLAKKNIWHLKIIYNFLCENQFHLSLRCPSFWPRSKAEIVLKLFLSFSISNSTQFQLLNLKKSYVQYFFVILLFNSKKSSLKLGKKGFFHFSIHFKNSRILNFMVSWNALNHEIRNRFNWITCEVSESGN